MAAGLREESVPSQLVGVTERKGSEAECASDSLSWRATSSK